MILLHLSDIGICASSGSTCTSGSLEPSHVLRAMGTPFTSLHGSIRFSLSRYTTEKEIDFVCEKQGEKLYIQVTYLLASEETVAREFGVYKGIPDNYPKYVVSMDELDMSQNGIKHRNIKDFLLMDTWE